MLFIADIVRLLSSNKIHTSSNKRNQILKTLARFLAKAIKLATSDCLLIRTPSV